MKILGWILKGIGKLLLAILLLLLTLIILLLFVPLRYRLTACKEGEQLKADGNVSWLFHFVHAGLHFADRKLNIVLRVLGIPLFKKDFSFGANDSESKTSEAKETSAPVLDSHSDQSQESSTSREKPEPKKTSGTVYTAPETNSESEETSHKKSLEEWLLALCEKLSQIWHSMRSRYDSVSEKLKKGKKLLFHERTQAAIRLLKRNVRRILRHIAPRRMQGQLRVGLPDNPGLMGQILVFASMLYPLYGEQLEFQPEYEEKLLEGHLQLSGRIIPGWLLFNALQLLFSRNVRFVRAVLKKWKQEA